MQNKELPDWAKKMSDAEWEKDKKIDGHYQNCATCNKRLILTLCHRSEEKNYCIEHCPEHKWQSDYDWPTECARCGLLYIHYLQSLLEQHNIPFSKP